jgi:hypothetical protein
MNPARESGLPRHALGAVTRDGSWLHFSRSQVDLLNVRQIMGAFRQLFFRPGGGLAAWIKEVLT